MSNPNEPNLNTDVLVEHLVADPSRIPDVTVLTGFLGPTSQPGHHRLYTNLQLDQFYEIADEDILHTEQRDPGRSSPAGTTVWVRREATIKHCVVGKARQMQAGFLKGALAAKFLPRTGVRGLTTGTPGRAEIPTWVICAISPAASIIIVALTELDNGCTNSALCHTPD